MESECSCGTPGWSMLITKLGLEWRSWSRRASQHGRLVWVAECSCETPDWSTTLKTWAESEGKCWTERASEHAKLGAFTVLTFNMLVIHLLPTIERVIVRAVCRASKAAVGTRDWPMSKAAVGTHDWPMSKTRGLGLECSSWTRGVGYWSRGVGYWSMLGNLLGTERRCWSR